MSFRFVRTLAVCSFVVANLGATMAHAAEATNLHDHPTLAPLQLIDGEYEGTKTSAKCIALSTKLFARRTTFLKASKEWRNMSGSDAYKALKESHDSLKGANCGASTAGAEEAACVALTDKVVQHANALGDTVQWKALTASKSWRTLSHDFAAAEKEGCIKPAPQTVGAK